MDDADDGSYSREPQLEDLTRLAGSLNARLQRLREALQLPDGIHPFDAAGRHFLQVCSLTNGDGSGTAQRPSAITRVS